MLTAMKHWFGQKAAKASRRPRRHGADRRFNTRKVRLQLETLECREVPAVITVGADQVVRTVTDHVLGANLISFDAELGTDRTLQVVRDAGLRLFRLSDGSGAELFHFNDPPAFNGASTANVLATLVANAGGEGVVTVNYGGGSPQEGAAYLAYLNGSPDDPTVIGPGPQYSDAVGGYVTKDWRTAGFWAGLRAAAPVAGDPDGLNFLRIGRAQPFGFKYFEVGNEQYFGSAIDHHAVPHDPATYVQFAAQFSALAKRIDPNVSVGLDVASPSANFTDWNQRVLQASHDQNFTPGFLSDHNYQYDTGNESDSALLLHNGIDPLVWNWTAREQAFRTLLQNTLGDQAAGVELLATEFNSAAAASGDDLSKQTTSLVNGLFAADAIGGILQSGYDGAVFWNLRNTYYNDPNPGGNGRPDDPNLYGWRRGGDYGLLGAVNVGGNFHADGVAPYTGPYIAYPTYFAEQLVSKAVHDGDTVVSANSDSPLVSAYAVRQQNGHLALLVINKSPTDDRSETIDLSGFTGNGQATLWQYGKDQDNAQRDSADGAASLLRADLDVNVNGGQFSFTFPSYSMTVLDLTPADQGQLAAPAVTGVTPGSGPTAGGTVVTITGGNFTGATAVAFGGVAAATFTVNSASQITATAPAHAAGTVDVTVRTAAGTSAQVAADQFTYNPPAPPTGPTVTGITPASGSTAGGTVVAVSGTNFVAVALVSFGDVSTSEFTIVSPTRITVRAPAHAAGAVDVTVTTIDGTSAAVAGDRFTYTQSAPQLTPTQRFVNQAYLDLLGRAADASGLAYFSGQLDRGSLSRFQVASILTATDEYRAKAVNDTYRALLGRDADPGALAALVPFLANGGTTEQVRIFLLGSQEYFARAGGTNDAFLTALYRDTVGRAVDDGGRAFWNGQLAAGASRFTAAIVLATSDEGRGFRVNGLFRQYLGRGNDPGANMAIGRFVGQGLLGEETLVDYLVSSDEYAGRL
jgi:hypothetical protein